AQEDAEKLRSIVMPMELEIASLKERLARAEDQLSADPSLTPSLPQRWEAGSPPREWVPEEGDGCTVADTFAANCTTWSTASGREPCPGRPLPAGREDTASLLSTGTLVPESIYLPPPGHHLLLDEEWSELQQEVKQHKVSLHQTREQLERESMVRKNLEEALRQSSDNCSHEIALLQEKVDSSALEVQRIREMFLQTQKRLQTQMVQLMATHKELCQWNRQLQGENQTLKELRTQPQAARSPASGGQGTGAPASLGQHSMEDIVGDLTQAAGCSQDRSNELQTALQEKQSELETLRTMYKQLNLELQARTEERSDLTGKLWEEKAKGQRLQVELDTSEQVQRDFVKLSQALQ
ncbi:rab GTPase-binding effector protein 2-like, partial [Mustelus asterias]